ncbi:MAG: 1-(5-phosphoribosyl)-5-[(5-phosphoribosylamino)methylideneamino]imidazole-4-carboxamide isomerase [Bacillota bacterium]
MIVFPAIDIRNGKCVRLQQGDFNKEIIYGENPVEVGKRWMDKGAEALHIVDLDGALHGVTKNLQVIRSIVDAVNIPVQLGGGIRKMEDIEKLLRIGVQRVILGTSAVHDAIFLKQAAAQFGSRVAVSVDAKDGWVAVDGWTKISDVKATDFIYGLEQKGIETVVYTDIAKDGMLSGPNFEEIKRIQENTGMNVIASGGVTSLDDVKRLSSYDLYGVIIGKALYTGSIKLEEIKGEIKNVD